MKCWTVLVEGVPYVVAPDEGGTHRFVGEFVNYSQVDLSLRRWLKGEVSVHHFLMNWLPRSSVQLAIDYLAGSLGLKLDLRRRKVPKCTVRVDGAPPGLDKERDRT